MILATRFGDRELRMAGEWGSEHIIPSPDGYGAIPLGEATGLPAVGAAIRLISGTIAAMTLLVWEGKEATKKLLDVSWQYELFQFPNDELSAFGFMWDFVSGPEACGNSYAYKARVRRTGRVGALSLLNPTTVTVRRDRDTGERIYEYWNGSETLKYPASDILHLRGDTIGSGDIGYSPLQMHRLSLRSQLARERFGGDVYLDNFAPPGVVLKFPQGVDREIARQYRDDWDADHAGSGNRGRTGVIGGGADITAFPISLEDQQFVETQRFSVEDVERMYGLPPGSLEKGAGGTSEEESLKLLKRLFPRIKRIEKAVKADPDLFGRGSRPYPEFQIDELLRADAKTLATVDHELVQSGILLVDEARARRGYGPMPPVPKDPNQEPGKVPQIVPVGGQANPGSAPPQE